MPPESERRATAFAPGHVTGLFDPDLSAADPRGRGSRGAGLVLELGAIADVRWRPRARSRVTVRSEPAGPVPISTEVATRLVGPYGGSLDVRVVHQLPVGQGFGMSAAGALATGFAIASVLGASRRHAIEVAHLADLYGGGGLGGVAAILEGGVELRRSPGIPPWADIAHAPSDARLLVAVAGPPIPSPSVLFDPRRLARIRRAASELSRLDSVPSVDRLLGASERFTDRVGLASPRLAGVIRGLRRRGAPAAQAMFGTSLFALLPSGARGRRLIPWLESTGVRGVVVRPDRRGARTLPSRAAPVRP